MKVKYRQLKCGIKKETVNTTKSTATITAPATICCNIKFHLIVITVLAVCLLNVNVANAYFNRTTTPTILTDRLINIHNLNQYDFDSYEIDNISGNGNAVGAGAGGNSGAIATTATTPTGNHFDNVNVNRSNRTNQRHRNGKFLFDALFGIEQNLEYDDVSEGDKIKTCNCGK